MRRIQSPHGLQQLTSRWRRQGRTIGFVPTMGALHAGHLRLIQQARRETDRVVVSIFVNPLQFTERRDYARYPRPLTRDAGLARAAGADVLFVPNARQLYPHDFQTTVEVTRVTRRWEGLSRPGHFRGVTTIVATLLNLAQPDLLYVGEKDAQQARAIQQLVHDLHWNLRVRVLPTVRESGGLAMSSRNVHLAPSERRRARALYEALQAGKWLIECGERRRSRLLRAMQQIIRRTSGARLDYLAVVDPMTLEPVRQVRGPVRLLIAVRLGSIRLIDTLIARP